jgi:hypothetical protein
MTERCPLPSVPGILLKRFSIPVGILGFLILSIGHLIDLRLCRGAGWVILALAPVPLALLGMMRLTGCLASAIVQTLERRRLRRAIAWLDELERKGGDDAAFAEACAHFNARFGSYLLNERVSDRGRPSRERYLRHAHSNILEEIACASDDPLAIRAWAEVLRRRHGHQAASEGEELQRHWREAVASPDPFALPRSG